MKAYHLTFFSKNKNSLSNAFLFFLTNSKTSKIQKYFQKKRKKKVLTLLKSPHVNKTAQEQFESHTYSKQLSKYNSSIPKTLFFFKTIKKSIFADLRVKVKFSINKKKEKKLQSQIFNPQNIKLKSAQKNFSQLCKINNIKNLNSKILLNNQIPYALKVFDIYGEMSLKNKSLDSSVGRAKD